MARNVNSSFILFYFQLRVFILSILVAYGVKITIINLDQRYDLGMKGH